MWVPAFGLAAAAAWLRPRADGEGVWEAGLCSPGGRGTGHGCHNAPTPELLLGALLRFPTGTSHMHRRCREPLGASVLPGGPRWSQGAWAAAAF